MKRDRKPAADPFQIIAKLTSQLEGKDAQIKVLVDEINSLEQTVSKLSDEVASLSRALYGTSSERSVAIGDGEDSDSQKSEQAEGEDKEEGDTKEGEDDSPSAEAGSDVASEVGECAVAGEAEKKQGKYHHPSKRDYSSVKPSRTVHVYPTEEEMDGARYVKTVYSRRFVYVPAHVEVVLIARHAYAKDGRLIMPPLPYVPESFEKRNMDATLGEGLLTGKYQYHIPIERQLDMLSHGKVKIAKSTLHDYVAASIDALEGLYEAIKTKVLSDRYSHIDETVQHLVDKETHRCRNAYDWGFVSPTYKMMYFTTDGGSRGQEVLDGQLSKFKGHYINTDGYGAYENAGKRNGLDIVQIPCLSHIRRKFVDSLKYHRELALQGLAKVNRIFWFEAALVKRKLTVKEIVKHRKRYLTWMLDGFKAWLKKQIERPGFFKEDNIGKAISYAWERIDKFYELLNNGRLVAHNNLAERCMRGHTVGRKNYLFCQNEASEKRTCKIYSIIESCKLSGIDPYRYLNYVYTRKPEDFKTWDELLPCVVKHRFK